MWYIVKETIQGSTYKYNPGWFDLFGWDEDVPLSQEIKSDPRHEDP